MNRRSFLAALGGSSLFVAVGGCSLIPPIPDSPEADMERALGWLAYRDGRYHMIMPRAEMGQGIDVALRQIVCAEIGIEMDDLDVVYHETLGSPASQATVGSESIMFFAIPMAQAAAALRDAVGAGQAQGEVILTERPMTELRSFAQEGLVGKSVVGFDQTALVSGNLTFGSDFSVPDMIQGRVLRAQAAYDRETRVVSYDLTAAQNVPGFIGVFEDDRLTLGGGRGLAILARDVDSLNEVEAVLEVQWQILGDAPTSIEDEIDVDRHYGDFAQSGFTEAGGDGVSRVDLRVDIAAAAHNPIEPRCAVAHVSEGKIDVWTGSQDIFYTRDVIARRSGFDEEAIHVRGLRLGGGFGSRTICTVEWEAVLLSMLAKKPVRVQWTRAQELSSGFHRPPVSYRFQAEMKDGAITEWSQRYVSSHILYTSAVLPAWLQSIITSVAGDGGVARGATPLYQIGDFDSDNEVRRLGFQTGPWRGLGAGPNGLAIEMVVDELCLQAGIDPLAFRLSNVSDPRLAEVCRRVGETSAWSSLKAHEQDGRRIGYGMAAGVYKETSYAAAVAEVSVGRSGDVKVERVWCVHDCGRVINPDRVAAQCEGNIVWSLGMVLYDTLEVEQGAVVARDFIDAPIPRMSDMPEVDVVLIESSETPTGAGETMMAVGPGAIANAIRNATGIRPTSFPLDSAEFRLS